MFDEGGKLERPGPDMSVNLGLPSFMKPCLGHRCMHGHLPGAISFAGTEAEVP